MSVLFGHPTGSPFAHNAALAHFEAGQLAAICVPWMPSALAVEALRRIGPIWPSAPRLARRRFPPLAAAPKVQGRMGEWRRLLLRALGRSHDHVAQEANDWLMRTMARECRAPNVTAVHAYEDCSLWQFEAAKRLGKACVYDMPIGYYAAWRETEAALARRYADWLPQHAAPSAATTRVDQKRREIELADLTLAPSSFVAQTIQKYHPDKTLALAPYGVDLDFWTPGQPRPASEVLRFICVGHLSIRKATPLLLDAWESAALPDARLDLVGEWKLAAAMRGRLPGGVTHYAPMAPALLRERYRAADIFVFPSFFEGLALVLLEAMACGLPAIASTAAGGSDLLGDDCGQVVPTGHLEALVESLRWFAANRQRLPAMRAAARARAERCTWENYRLCVTAAVAPFL